MNQNSPKFLIFITIFLTIFVLSAASFLMLKDKKIDFGKIASIFNIFSKEKNKKSQTAQADTKKRQLLDKSAIESPEAQIDENNLTKKLSRNLAATALLTNFDVNTLENNPGLVDKAFEQAGVDPETVFPLPEISDDEIKISNDNSKEAIEEYISKMYNLFEKFGSKTQSLLSSENAETSVEIMQQAIDSKDFSKIEEFLENNKEILEELKKISVPSSWKNIHKEQIALLILEKNIYQATREVENDFLKAIMALQRYPDLFISMNDLLDKMVALRKAQE